MSGDQFQATRLFFRQVVTVRLLFLSWSINPAFSLVRRAERFRVLTMKIFLLTLSALSCIAPVLGYVQAVLNSKAQPSNRSETAAASVLKSINDGSNLTHLSSIASNEFTALSHPRFPNHQVRIKKSNFCDPTVKWVVFDVTRRVYT